MKNHPGGLQKELQYLERTFSNAKNGYPRYLLRRWTRNLEKEIRKRPQMLKFQSKSTKDRTRIEHGQETDQMDDEPTVVEKPKRTLIIPYVPGVSDQLRTIARRFEVPVWFSYSGKLGDGLSSTYKDKQHESKQRYAVYEAVCSCNKRYIGESLRNLKVRIMEHKSIHSESALAVHLRIGYAHNLLPNLTRTIFKEKQYFKRKILESLVILNYPDLLCNKGPSTNISEMWDGCREKIRLALIE